MPESTNVVSRGDTVERVLGVWSTRCTRKEKDIEKWSETRRRKLYAKMICR